MLKTFFTIINKKLLLIFKIINFCLQIKLQYVPSLDDYFRIFIEGGEACIQKCGKGDRMGVGMRTTTTSDSTFKVYFTRNGIKVREGISYFIT